MNGDGCSHIVLSVYSYCCALKLKCVILTPTANSAQIFKDSNPSIESYTYHSYLKVGYAAKDFRLGDGSNYNDKMLNT